MIDKLLSLNWTELFVPDSSIAEMMLRGTVTYLGLFVILRLLRRPAGQLGMADILLITVLADAAQNAMGGSYESISSGFALIGTIVFWDRLIDSLAYRYPRFARLVEPPPAVLIENGMLRRAAMKKHRISNEELLAHLRLHGVDDPLQVKRCLLEGDGNISVLKS
jgi:uncharacterized membrane protein YcaP (DUF421 family)